MPDQIPPNLYTQQIPGKGTSLFTSGAIDAGELVFHIERPLLCVPDNRCLNEVCYHCFMWLPEGVGIVNDVTTRLLVCMGCKVARYCSKKCQSTSWKVCHKYECKIYGRLYPRLLPSAVRTVMQLLLRKKAKSLPEEDWQDFLNLQAHIEDIKNDSARNGKGSDKWQDVELMSQATLEYSQVIESSDLIQSMIARCLVNSMTVTSLGFDPLGTCVSTYASKMNHSCNPNCAVIFSGASLSVRSLQSIRAGGELTQSYVDRTMPTSRRRQSLRSVYYFDCTCDYCKSALTCGLPDPPELLKTRLSLDEVMNLETEGMRLYSISEKASPLEKTGLLGKAMGLFYAIKDMYPLWRYPWPTIRHAVTLAQMTLEHWYEALGHALKGYFYIEPVLYPTTWDPLRTMRTFLLVKIMVEIEYNKSQSQDAGSALGNLDRYQINWPVAISGLMAEVQAAIPKGFGTDSGFAREFEQLRRGVGLEDGGWISLWGREREKLKKPAREMVD